MHRARPARLLGFAEGFQIDCGPRPGLSLLVEFAVDVGPAAMPVSLAWIGLDDVVRDMFPVDVGQEPVAEGYVYRGALCWEEYAEARLRLQITDAVGRASPARCVIAAVDASGE